VPNIKFNNYKDDTIQADDFLAAVANENGTDIEKLAYQADKLYIDSVGNADIKISDSIGYLVQRSGGVLARYMDPANNEAIIDTEMSPETLASLLENLYPRLVAYETEEAYKAASDTFDISYWIDDTIGEIAAKRVSDSEEASNA